MPVTVDALADSVSPENVHSHIPQRPEFTADSHPSLDDVYALTVGTARAVVGAVGGVLPDSLLDYAITVVEVGTAAKVEGRYFPEQQLGGLQYEQLNAEYLDNLRRLVAQHFEYSSSGFNAGSFSMDAGCR